MEDKVKENLPEIILKRNRDGKGRSIYMYFSSCNDSSNVSYLKINASECETSTAFPGSTFII